MILGDPGETVTISKCCWSTVSRIFLIFFFEKQCQKIILMSKMKKNAFLITIHRVDRLEFRDSGGGTVFAMCVCVCVVMCGGGGTVFAMRVV